MHTLDFECSRGSGTTYKVSATGFRGYEMVQANLVDDELQLANSLRFAQPHIALLKKARYTLTQGVQPAGKLVHQHRIINSICQLATN